jgi:hypothetical protein
MPHRIAMFSQQHVHVLGTLLKCDCHGLAMMILTWYCNVLGMLLPWPAHVKSMARAWQGHGKSTTRAYQEHGKGIGRASSGYDKGMFVLWYCHDLVTMPLPCVWHSLDMHALTTMLLRVLEFSRAWPEHVERMAGT